MKPQRRSYIQQCECIATGLGAAAAGVGSASTAILRWAAVPVPTDASIVVTDSATAGMSYLLAEAGSYEITLSVAGVINTSLMIGLSLNAAVSPIVANPAMGVDGVFAVDGPQVSAGGTIMTSKIHTTIRIEPSEVGAILRMHATNIAGATPVPSMTAATSWMRIVRTHDGG